MNKTKEQKSIVKIKNEKIKEQKETIDEQGKTIDKQNEKINNQIQVINNQRSEIITLSHIISQLEEQDAERKDFNYSKDNIEKFVRMTEMLVQAKVDHNKIVDAMTKTFEDIFVK